MRDRLPDRQTEAFMQTTSKHRYIDKQGDQDIVRSTEVLRESHVVLRNESERQSYNVREMVLRKDGEIGILQEQTCVCVYVCGGKGDSCSWKVRNGITDVVVMSTNDMPWLGGGGA